MPALVGGRSGGRVPAIDGRTTSEQRKRQGEPTVVAERAQDRIGIVQAAGVGEIETGVAA